MYENSAKLRSVIWMKENFDGVKEKGLTNNTDYRFKNAILDFSFCFDNQTLNSKATEKEALKKLSGLREF